MAEIDKPKLENLMRLKPTLEDTAAFFEVSARTIERFIRTEYDLTFVEFRQQRMVHTRHALVRKALEKALKGDNTMLIFCLKNLCGWSDKQDISANGDGININLNYKLDEPEGK